jgi:hypothetical protein
MLVGERVQFLQQENSRIHQNEADVRLTFAEASCEEMHLYY